MTDFDWTDVRWAVVKADGTLRACRVRVTRKPVTLRLSMRAQKSSFWLTNPMKMMNPMTLTAMRALTLTLAVSPMIVKRGGKK